MKFKRTVLGDDVSPVGTVIFDFMRMMGIFMSVAYFFYAKITKDTSLKLKKHLNSSNLLIFEVGLVLTFFLRAWHGHISEQANRSLRNRISGGVRVGGEAPTTTRLLNLL